MAEEIQSKVAEVLAVVLAVDRVLMDDDFFMLGGDSLAATVLMSAIELHFGVVIDPVEIFERPKIGEFVSWLDDAIKQSSAAGPDVANPGATARQE